MGSDLDKMFAYQQIMEKRGNASVCHTAILKCEYGSQPYVLNLSKSHGKYIGSHAQIDVKDGKNAYFGYCSKLKGPCQAVLSDWYNGNGEDLMFDEGTLMMEASVQKGIGFMVCMVKGKG